MGKTYSKGTPILLIIALLFLGGGLVGSVRLAIQYPTPWLLWPILLSNLVPGLLLLSTWWLARRFPLQTNKGLWVAGALLLTGGLVASLLWIARYWVPILWSFHIVNVAPGLLALLVCWLGSRFPDLAWTKVGAGIPIVVLGIFFLLITNGMATLSTPIRNPARYEELLEKHRYPETKWIAHFPPSIPQTASKVNLYYERTFMQGSYPFEMRYVLPKADLARVRESMYENKDLSTTSEFSLRKDHYGPSQIDADSLDEQVAGGYGENHGGAYGIAINSRRNEVLYWADRW